MKDLCFTKRSFLKDKYCAIYSNAISWMLNICDAVTASISVWNFVGVNSMEISWELVPFFVQELSLITCLGDTAPSTRVPALLRTIQKLHSVQETGSGQMLQLFRSKRERQQHFCILVIILLSKINNEGERNWAVLKQPGHISKKVIGWETSKIFCAYRTPHAAAVRKWNSSSNLSCKRSFPFNGYFISLI